MVKSANFAYIAEIQFWNFLVGVPFLESKIEINMCNGKVSKHCLKLQLCIWKAFVDSLLVCYDRRDVWKIQVQVSKIERNGSVL